MEDYTMQDMLKAASCAPRLPIQDRRGASRLNMYVKLSVLWASGLVGIAALLVIADRIGG